MSLEHSRHFNHSRWNDKYPDILITRNELAEMLGISRGTIDVWVSTKRVNIPFVRIGKAIRYRISDVLAYLEKNTVKTYPAEVNYEK